MYTRCAHARRALLLSPRIARRAGGYAKPALTASGKALEWGADTWRTPLGTGSNNNDNIWAVPTAIAAAALAYLTIPSDNDLACKGEKILWVKSYGKKVGLHGLCE